MPIRLFAAGMEPITKQENQSFKPQKLTGLPSAFSRRQARCLLDHVLRFNRISLMEILSFCPQVLNLLSQGIVNVVLRHSGHIGKGVVSVEVRFEWLE